MRFFDIGFSEAWRSVRERLKTGRRMCWMVGILALMLWGSLGQREVSASSASISITTKHNTVVSGDVVYVIITVKSSQEISGFEGYFSYDNRVLEFQTGGSVVYGNDDEFRVEDVERDSGSTSIKYSVKFVARHEGSTVITLKKPYNVFGDSTSDKMSVSYHPLTIVVHREAQASPSASSAGQTPSDGSSGNAAGRAPEQPGASPATTPIESAKQKKKQKKKEAAEKAETDQTPGSSENPEPTENLQTNVSPGINADSSNGQDSQETLEAQRWKYVAGIFAALSALLLLAVIAIYRRYRHDKMHLNDTEED